jgi:hypothetical protein
VFNFLVDVILGGYSKSSLTLVFAIYPKVLALTLVVMVVLSCYNLHPRLIPVSSTYASDHYHR